MKTLQVMINKDGNNKKFKLKSSKLQIEKLNRKELKYE